MIGILGGTFDPIHNGHLHIAAAASKRLQLQQVRFMPCSLPVHRTRPHASVSQRCDMIELALAERPDFVLDTLEIDRGGPSYMIDSLHEIRRRGPARLLLLLGTDAFNRFGEWRQPLEILQLASLLICARPGIEPEFAQFEKYRVDSVEQLQRRPSGAILTLEVDAPDCSSSEVRNKLVAGEIPRPWLHPAVADYIQTHHLYRSTGD